MKILRGLIGLSEMVIVVITVVNLWQTELNWLAVTWLVYLVFCLCVASYETGKDTKGRK